jgi:hypothetical protein
VTNENLDPFHFCAFRFKAIPESLSQKRRSLIAENGLKISASGPSEATKPSTIVLIALEDWHEGNGFSQEIKVGEDICLDGDEVVKFPGTGGALGIFISLSL